MMFEKEIEQDNFQASLVNLQKTLEHTGDQEKTKQKSWQQFLCIGLPKRNNEAYRNIKLRTLYSQTFCMADEKLLTKESVSPWIYPECLSSVAVFVNGHYAPHLSNYAGLPQKVAILPLEEAAATYSTFLTNSWSKNLKEETDPFALLNGAFHRKGLFFYVPPKTIVETPIQILHLIDSSASLAWHTPRLHLFVGANAEVKLINTHKNLANEGCIVNQVAEFTVEEGARVHYTQIMADKHPQRWHFDAVRATVKKGGSFNSVCLSEGSAATRTDYKITLTGENAEGLLSGLSLLSGKSEMHTHILMEHQAPACRSYQLFKGVLNDFSRSSFEGKIMVRQAAQKTEAFQLNNNLLIGDHAQVNSKPNLEIFADDVKASHGATIGQLDEEQLFYMKTRGFSDRAAKNLLVYGFCEQIIAMLPINSLKEEIIQKARHYLIENGEQA